MKEKIKEWTLEIAGALLIILGLINEFFFKKPKTIEADEEDIELREKEEEREELRVGELLKKKRTIMTQLSQELKQVTETSQIYTSEKIMKLIYGEEGLQEINKKLENLDEKLLQEKKEDIEELKELSGLLKADEEELRKKGITLNTLWTTENNIKQMQEAMKGLFEVFDDRIREENRILQDKKTLTKMVENAKEREKHFKELNKIIIYARKHLQALEHEHLRELWEKHLLKKIDEINQISMSTKERKEIITYIRKNFVNPIKEKLKGEDLSWLDQLETRMIQHEHLRKDKDWESKLEKAVWDLSDEMRKEWMIHQHLETGFKRIDAEMTKLKQAIGYKKTVRIAAA
jgi:hypothetical protein